MVYKENDIVENLKVYSEEDNGDIVHNHIDCPVCKNKNAGTGCYGSLDKDTVIVCGWCGSEFELVSGKWYKSNKVKIIKIGE